jgi:hypothetical protein
MASYFPKNTALTLFCLFRQAERSVHYALSCPSQWSQFVAYYDEPKQIQISEAIGMLNDAGAAQDKVPSRQALARSGLLNIVSCAAGLLTNRLRRSWAFSVRELSFFSATLEHLLKILNNTDLPQKEELIGLRLDCFDCHYVISRRLIGVPEIQIANSIEHFNQSEYVRHVNFQDLGIHALGTETGTPFVVGQKPGHRL